MILADDDFLLREGLASMLERAGFKIVGQPGDAADLLSQVRAQQPGLTSVDIRMPPSHTTEGLDAAHTIRAELPDVGIVVLSAYAEVEHAMELLASGQSIGYLLKNRVTECNTSARRKICFTQVHVEEKLIPGELPAFSFLGDKRYRTGIHNVDLHVGMR